MVGDKARAVGGRRGNFLAEPIGGPSPGINLLLVSAYLFRHVRALCWLVSRGFVRWTVACLVQLLQLLQLTSSSDRKGFCCLLAKSLEPMSKVSAGNRCTRKVVHFQKSKISAQTLRSTRLGGSLLPHGSEPTLPIGCWIFEAT